MTNSIDGRSTSRRKFLKHSSALAASVLAMPALLRSAYAADEELVFASNGGSNQKIFEEVIIPKFTEQTGIKVTFVAGGSAEFVAKMRTQGSASGFDVVWLGGATPFSAADEGLLDPYDPELVPNAALIKPENTREKDVLAIGVSGNCLVYSKPVFEANGWAPPTEWIDLWDPKYAGHTGMYGMSSTGGLEMLFQMARELSGDYENLDPAFAKFKELRQSIYEFFPNAGAWETALQQGDLWLGINSHTRGLQLTQAGMPIGVVLPKSGTASHELAVAIAKGAPNQKAANTWINFLLEPETQLLIAEQLGFAPTVEGVVIPDAIKPFFPAEGEAWFPDWRKASTRFDEIVDRWQREVEA